ncbi:galactose oxidase [Pleomassaria siparia CBS 279.74]|uniref:Galactose oxidase n=1 Tax=Pleomassaria siparia CBS 279.74 TaxID=1314801 RepID=A0A6G1KA74_9PLEO|nr:galactose oxidase [Pleomassaria siparia CBS 279.74]
MLPLGVVAYPSVRASTTPLEDSESIWKKPSVTRLKRALSKQRRRTQESASTLLRSYRSVYSARSEHSSLFDANHSPSTTRPKHVPIIIPRYVPIVAPSSPCTSALLSSSSSTSTTASSNRLSLSSFPLPGRKSIRVSSNFRSRHVEIVIPTWTLPLQRFSTSPISLPNRLIGLPTPVSPSSSLSPASMARQTPGTSRTTTMDSQTSAPSPSQLYPDTFRGGPGNGAYISSSLNSSQTSLNGQDGGNERPPTSSARITPNPGATVSPSMMQTAGLSTPSGATSGLSGLVCNVHRTTGREPHPLVGATTTILGDKLFVFGGRRLSRTRPQLTSDLYELDLVKRHWTKVDAKGDLPPPRYFHSVCALGDTKLVCYGGMSPASQQPVQPTPTQGNPADAQPEVVVMSDVHIYDLPTRTWMRVATADAPQGRYAHCATILPSSAMFSSTSATLAAIRHNPSSAPNQGLLGVQLDGEGGAEMVVVGGQDSANHYIEQISVFNLRSLKWTATNTLGRSCGAYRSVVAPLTSVDPSKIGMGARNGTESQSPDDRNAGSKDGGAAMLIYSNYNFLDVKLELQVRLPDGTLSEKPMHGNFSPPGLRFPNGGVINNHFVVSGTFLTSSKQEYALWALDLRTLSWGRIEAGGSIFSQGSWNRGILWNRRNCFVILGNRKRSLVEDYNHRRINFSNICVVELEAFGLYDNPRKVAPNSAFTSVSAPRQTERLDLNAGGRMLSPAAAELGQMALGMRELADMDFLAIHGERIPVNSRIIARRWGPYFNQLLSDCRTNENADTATLRPLAESHTSRYSSVTITPSIKTTYSSATTLTNNTSAHSEATSSSSTSTLLSSLNPPEPSSQPPSQRPRTLYLPHTHLTLQALIHFLYTSSLPPKRSPLCSPQILCSLLQLARPYHIDGLLEAIIERLHVLLDNRNTAAIFNAAAMAAGGGSGVAFSGVNGVAPNGINGSVDLSNGSSSSNGVNPTERSLDAGLRALRINTENLHSSGHDDEVSSATSTSTTASESGFGDGNGSGIGSEREVWGGEVSAVVGLQKRGLRGLMEGRRIREMGGRGSSKSRDEGGLGSGGDGVGLGLLGP